MQKMDGNERHDCHPEKGKSVTQFFFKNVSLLGMQHNDVHAGDLSDNDQYLRGALFRILYPSVIGLDRISVIGPDRIAKYLVKPSDSIIGWYHMFLHHNIFELTDKNGLRVLAHTYQNQNNNFVIGDEFDDSSFISNLIRNLIETFGEEIKINELFSWLTMGINQYGSSRIRGDEAKAIRTFLANNDQIYISLFFVFFNKRWTYEKKLAPNMVEIQGIYPSCLSPI